MCRRYGIGHVLRLSNKLLLMDAKKILEADVLDIVFEGRNKEYGAYQLRKTYNRRLTRAMSVTAAVILGLFVTGLVVGRDNGKVRQLAKIDDVALDAYKEKTPEVIPPVIPPKPIEQKIEIKQFTPPRIVKDSPELYAARV